MDVCVENVFPAVAAPFNSFSEDAREGKDQETDASRVRAIPNVVHVAIDAFFASVEQVLNPRLRGKAVLVGRGIVAAASDEAKMCGVKTGMLVSEALRICPSAIAMSGHYDCYAEFAERVRRVLETYTPAVEAGALDDFYLDFAGTKQSYLAYEAILRRIQAEILEETGLSVSIGAARTKAVAAMASRRGEPRGFQMIAPGTEESFLAPLPVETLRGIGRIDTESLAARGITTLGELRKVPRAVLESAFGEVSGRQIWASARGIDGRESGRLSARKPASLQRETVSREMSLEGGTSDREFLDKLLGYLCQRVSCSLRERGQQARTIGLQIRYVDGFTARQTARFTHPASDERELVAEVKELFAELFTRRVALQSLRVNGTNLDTDQRQEELRGSDLANLEAQHAAPLQMAAS
jgi:DNA polymerase-4